MANVEYIPKYSKDDYLFWEGDWELWNGIAVAMSPSPNFRHQKIAMRISSSIHSQLSSDPCGNKCEAVYEMDWHVNENTVVRPDVMVVCKEPKNDFVEEAPTLISEVLSPTTRHKDLTSKRDLYASTGVKYYLIFDPEKDSAQFLELDEQGTYREIDSGSELVLDEDCVIRINVAEIF